MSSAIDYDFVIYTGEPDFHYTRASGPRKSNKLIDNLLRLDVGQFIHFPTDKKSKSEDRAKKQVKNAVGYVQRHYKPRKYRTGSAIHNGVWGITIQRKPDDVVKNTLTF